MYYIIQDKTTIDVKSLENRTKRNIDVEMIHIYPILDVLFASVSCSERHTKCLL